MRDVSGHLTIRPLCSFQYNRSDQHNINLNFLNNTAGLGGSAIYGGMLDACENSSLLSFGFSSLIDNITTIIVKSENTTDSIASNPNRVCSCSEYRKCTESNMSREMYPGQTVKLLVLTVGQRNGTVPAVIRATLNTSTARIGHLQSTQNTTTFCTNISYTVLSSESVAMTLKVAGMCSDLGQSLTVKLKVLDCPAGFDLSHEAKTCVCQWRLRKYTDKCNISDQTIHRVNKHFWVGYTNESTEHGLILHPYCPFDYCTTAPVSFTVNDTDKQCNYNRTGILCGQCKPGFSLVLGASFCRNNCENTYASLIVMFVIAGFVMVIFLFTLRINISTGTINGLIFYANIVYINQASFFQTKQNNILSVFIAWINLDLGIETCFYKEMDTYTNTWLQFVFPFYIWILCISLILLSKKLSCLTVLLGRNPTAVLATLFLLSYTKILRTITAVLSFTRVEYPHNQSRIVWLYDANVPNAKWLPLAVFSAVVFFLLLPYTLFLFANQWLLAWSDWHILSWMNSPRVKYFLDPHTAPLKPKHLYWTGLLLFARLAVQITLAANVIGNPALNNLAISIVTASLAAWQSVWGSPYMNIIITVLEVFFIANILFLASAAYYASLTGGNIDIFSYISNGLAFCIFLGILYFTFINV